MVRKTTIEAIDKLKSMIDGNEAISAKLQTRILKQIDIVTKKIKAPVKKERISGTFEFEKLFPISQEMADFANWDPSSKHSRVDITRIICSYIVENKLQNPENRRIIFLDEPLKHLLGVSENTITYPRIQKYVGQHLGKTKTV